MTTSNASAKNHRTATKLSSRLMREPGTVAAAQAKAHFLQLIEEVSREGIPVTVSKRGKAMVRIVPLDDRRDDPFGCMKGTVTITGDIVGPEPDHWEAME